VNKLIWLNCNIREVLEVRHSKCIKQIYLLRYNRAIIIYSNNKVNLWDLKKRVKLACIIRKGKKNIRIIGVLPDDNIVSIQNDDIVIININTGELMFRIKSIDPIGGTGAIVLANGKIIVFKDEKTIQLLG
jgi:hypothetical protein